MRGRDFYIVVLAVFVVGVVSIAISPELTITVLAALVPVVIAAALVSTLYLVHVYQAQPVPRSRFFGMLIETFFALVTLGVWVGYLTVGRLLERAELGWSFPVPAPAVSSPMTALIVILVFGAPVRFAIEVYRIRRHSSAPRSVVETADLDRRDPPMPDRRDGGDSTV